MRTTALLLCLVGCEPGTAALPPAATGTEPAVDTAVDTAAPSTGDTGTTSTADTAAPQAACIAHALPRVLHFTVDGADRSALLAGPTELPDEPLALVLNFHGYTHDAPGQEGYSLMSDHALAEGYVVAYPQGTGAVPAWNAGVCCGAAARDEVDDVAYTAALIDEIAAVACIDTERVYAVGLSNGGFLSHRLGCELSDRLAGIAAVAGVLGVETCTPSRPLPVLQIHGTADLLVPYDGNAFLGYPSAEQTAAGWRERNGCTAASTVTFQQGDATCVTWDDCAQPVSLCTVDGGGHTWPGGTLPAIYGKTSTDLDATAGMWQFFQDATVSHPLR